MVKTDIEALTKRIEKLEAQVGKNTGDPLVGHLVEYSNDLGNSLAGNDRILPLMKRLDELETYLDPLFGEKEACSLGVKMSLGKNFTRFSLRKNFHDISFLNIQFPFPMIKSFFNFFFFLCDELLLCSGEPV